MLSINGIETFATVAKYSSFKKAAEKLNLSAPTISIQIKALEDRLGIQLLQRSTRKVVLTEIGHRYLQRCQYILSELRTTEEWLLQLIDEPQGKLNIACFTSFWHSKIKQHLKVFLKRYPKIELNFNLEEIVPDLENSDIDLFIGAPESIPVPNLWVRRKIYTAQYCFATTKQYLQTLDEPISIKNLDKLRYITHTVRKPDNVLPIKGNKTITVNNLLRVNELDAMLALTLDGLGVMWTHDYLLEPYFKSKKLIEILPQYKPSKFPIYLYYLENRYLHPTVRHFIDFIVTALEA